MPWFRGSGEQKFSLLRGFTLRGKKEKEANSKSSALKPGNPWEQSITWDADNGLTKKLGKAGGDGTAQVLAQKLNNKNVLTFRVRLANGKECEVPWHALRNFQAGRHVTAEPPTCCDERGYMRQYTITVTSQNTSGAEAWVLAVAYAARTSNPDATAQTSAVPSHVRALPYAFT